MVLRKLHSVSFFLLFTFAFLLFTSCGVEKRIARSAKENVLNNAALKAAHVGISIYDAASGKYLYNYQGDKYFVPASNTKLPTCYAAMKYLGDSLVGLRYGYSDKPVSSSRVLVIQPTGDPSFLLTEFKNQPVFDFLKEVKNKRIPVGIMDTVWNAKALGNGWSWNDYMEDYMAERSSFPVFGNVINVRRVVLTDILNDNGPGKQFVKTIPGYFNTTFNDLCAINTGLGNKFSFYRRKDDNQFWISDADNVFKGQVISFATKHNETSKNILQDTLKGLHFTEDGVFPEYKKKNTYDFVVGEFTEEITVSVWHTIHSQPTDSLLKPMMHRSDNFFAEQSLLMVSNTLLGVMNDEKIIDTLLKTDFSDLPQKPRWADGSGLSRYNLFTPQDFVAILSKMKNEFGMERLKVILPTGGEGTISNYYKSDSGYIYAKTGTLSGVVAFSGFLYTKKGKLLIFSSLVNNHRGSATDVRRAIEKFLQQVRADF